MLHGWPALGAILFEVVTVVVGILIALWVNNVAEDWQWKQRVDVAKQQMDTELLRANRDAYYRLAVRSCGLVRLAQIEDALVASRDHGTPVPLMAPYVRPRRPWLVDAWENSRSMQVAGHMPADIVMNYARAYFFARSLQLNQRPEMEAINDLNSLQMNAGRLRAEERDRLFLTLSHAYAAENGISSLAWLLITRTQLLGVRLSDADKREQLDMARKDYGACVVTPDLDRPPSPSDIATTRIPVR